MMKRLAPILIIFLVAIAAGCDGGGKDAITSQTRPTTTASEETVLEERIRSALNENRRLSVYVLWNNRLPSWAKRSTRGPALASLRSAAQNRRNRGVRVRMLENRRQILSIRLDPSYLRATAIVLDHQRVQPARRSGRPLGRATMLNERARYELRRLGRRDQFVVWRVVLLR